MEPCVEYLSADAKGSYLAAMQQIVGGVLECIGLGDGLDIWCNDEALCLGLSLNREIPAFAPSVPPGFQVMPMSEGLARPGELGVFRIHGNFFFARADDEGDVTSVSDEDIAAIHALFSHA
jgi:hypothetical protein